MSGEDGSAKFGEVVEGVVAGVILDVDYFEGAECYVGGSFLLSPLIATMQLSIALS